MWTKTVTLTIIRLEEVYKFPKDFKEYVLEEVVYGHKPDALVPMFLPDPSDPVYQQSCPELIPFSQWILTQHPEVQLDNIFIDCSN
jgi:hypothetical protein